MTAPRVAGLLLACLLAPVAANAARPNLSGRWQLDVARSDYARMEASKPRSRLEVIEHRDPSLVFHSFVLRANGDSAKYNYHYSTDGKPGMNDVMGQKVQSTAKWSGDTLVVESKGRMMMFDVSARERWWLERGGKTLHLERASKSPMGEMVQTLVFTKR